MSLGQSGAGSAWTQIYRPAPAQLGANVSWNGSPAGRLRARGTCSAKNVAGGGTNAGVAAAAVFKDAYAVGFLNLPADHTEADLHRGLLASCATS